MPIIANLVIGRDGGTTVGGRSAPLSSALDRQRFHELRAMADAIVVGGQTARIEPYGKTPVPLIVVTNSAQLPGPVGSNPNLQISNQNIPETLRNVSLQFNMVLIEAGANFVTEALAEKLIDDLYITQVQTPAAAPFFDYSSLGSDFTLVQREGLGGEEFLHYARLPQND